MSESGDDPPLIKKTKQKQHFKKDIVLYKNSILRLNFHKNR